MTITTCSTSDPSSCPSGQTCYGGYGGGDGGTGFCGPTITTCSPSDPSSCPSGQTCIANTFGGGDGGTGFCITAHDGGARPMQDSGTSAQDAGTSTGSPDAGDGG